MKIQTAGGATRCSDAMISLDRAFLCVNCEMISETQQDCLHCGSKQLMPMLPMIGGSLFPSISDEVRRRKTRPLNEISPRAATRLTHDDGTLANSQLNKSPEEHAECQANRPRQACLAQSQSRSRPFDRDSVGPLQEA
jgi:hypothetical protein